MTENQKNEMRTKIEKMLSEREFVFRNDPIRKQIDGLSAAALANLDCRKLGPANAFFVGRKLAYPKSDYIDFVLNRCVSK